MITVGERKVEKIERKIPYARERVYMEEPTERNSSFFEFDTHNKLRYKKQDFGESLTLRDLASLEEYGRNL